MPFPADSLPGIKVTGPVHHWIQVNTPYIASGTTTAGYTGSIYYLGTAEIQPQVTIQRLRIPVKNDIMGRLQPAQTVYQGQMAQIGVALNRLSLPAINELRASGLYGVQLGYNDRWAIGSLEFYNMSFKLWQTYDRYWTGPPTGADQIPPGRYWPCVLINQEIENRTGAIDWTKGFIFDAYSAPTCSGGIRTSKLYSEDPADFPASVQTPIC